MEMFKYGLQTHSGASSQSCHSVDADAWCKWALTENQFSVLRLHVRIFPALNPLVFVRWNKYSDWFEVQRNFVYVIFVRNLYVIIETFNIKVIKTLQRHFL